MKGIHDIIFQIFKKVFSYLSISCAIVFIIYTLYAIPAMISLPGGIRPGLKSLTIEDAIQALEKKDLDGMELIEEARSMVGSRMAYCRRNSYESYKKAFKRGYGFCQQQAFALAKILEGLNFEAVPVQSIQTRFPEGEVGGHSWVRIKMNEEYLYIDPVYYNSEKHEITFSPISEVTEFSSFFRILSGWGSATINAHRYYTSGSD